MVNGTISQPMPVLSGVPQGSVLGPLLFNIFINDIGDNIKSNFLLYADDLKIFSTCNNTIQNDLNTITNWCQLWQMEVAPSKCECISFTKSRRLTSRTTVCDLVLNNSNLNTSEIIRDLGVLFNSSLQFDVHITQALRKAQRRINIIFNVLRLATFEVLIKCYTIYVRPIVEYATVVFSPVTRELTRKLESIQKSFIHRCYRKFGMIYESYFKCLEMTKLESLEYRRLIFDMVFIYKSLVSKELYCEDGLLTCFTNFTTLRRHPYYLKCNLANSSKTYQQYISNRSLRFWNSLPSIAFPVKPSSLRFKSNLKSLNLDKFLSLTCLNY
uniref:Reverse transcriptase domain-containing protein n=1 Tax=Caenorhabditis japonica TaxID=281687 RepID=A0A8R1IG11_CAEJA